MVESEIETASETPRRKRKQEFLTADRWCKELGVTSSVDPRVTVAPYHWISQLQRVLCYL